MWNSTAATRAPTCRSCGRRLLRRLALFAPLHSRDAANFYGYLEPSLRLFWPDAWLIAGLDHDDSRNFEARLLAGGVVSEVRRVSRRPSGLDNWGWQMLLTWLEGEKLEEFAYVGVVDSDALFTAPVVEDSLFRGGLPVMHARVGPPRSVAWTGFPVRTWAWLMGIPWRLDCMTHFPFIVHRQHFVYFREYIETVHKMNFTAAYLRFASHDLYMLHTALCNYIWDDPQLRLEYRWHLFEEPGPWRGRLVSGQAALEDLQGMHLEATASRAPWPGATIHAGHWIGLGKLRGDCHWGGLVPRCGRFPRTRARTARILLQGVCRSLPRRGGAELPEACASVDEADIFPSLFSHEGDERGWLATSFEQCLEAQSALFARIRRALTSSPGYEAALRELVPVLGKEARGAELLQEDVDFVYQNAVVGLLCYEASCLREFEEGQGAVQAGLERAVRLLLQAHAAYSGAEAAASRIGFILERNELRARVFDGL